MPHASLSGMEWTVVNASNLLPFVLIPTLSVANKQAKEMNKNHSLYICLLTFLGKAILARV